MQPLVSILIPCYNAATWIAQSIQSALDQTYANKEVIVVDDGSTDNSLEIIRTFGDRIRIESGPNRGGNVARNRLMQLSRGEWLEFLDADDFLLPRKIETQIGMLANRPEVDVFYSAALLAYGESGAQPDAAIVDEDLYANYFRWDYFTTTVLLLKKSALIDVGGWNEAQKVCQEHELVLRLIMATKQFALTPHAMGVIRVQSVDSVSRRSPLNTLIQKMALSDRLEDYLFSIREMNELRRIALSQARFQAARAAYTWDRKLARTFSAKALSTGPFVPPSSVNRYYCFILRAFGFDIAERVARLRGKLLKIIRGSKPPSHHPPLPRTLSSRDPQPKASCQIRNFAIGLNSWVGRFCLRVLPESKCLIVVAFHGVFQNPSALQNKSVNPRYVVSLDQFEQCVLYYRSRGYLAVSPMDILRGLPSGGRYVMFTFDDGYANNLQVIPVLEKYGVPAMFALTTDYILQQKPFWWDILYRQRRARGSDSQVIDREVDDLIRENPSAIERQLVDEFGQAVLTEMDDFGRPMRPEEVKEIANNPLVFWANHTAQHEFLPNCDPNALRLTIGRAQDTLQELTGSRPESMVYPYGSHTSAIRSVCREFGLRLGFTMDARKQSIKLDCNSDRAMTIPRYAIYNDSSVEQQCLETRIVWKPSWLLGGHSGN
jgi:glycosyltransferase involved in cell wall biosynthesis/peptidoglycan/xylan/chitin deacetylase (PgdA/CDA1 family)